MRKSHRKIGIGGTFDHFHAGHQEFIRFAASLADFVLIGVTSEKMSRHKPLPHLIEPFKARKAQVISFCKKNHLSSKVIPLTDPYGPTIESGQVDALCVTQDTQAGGQAINELRNRLNLRPLPIHVCPLTLDQTDLPISSSRIRAGEINRAGTVYHQAFHTTITLNPQQREYFSQPQGNVVTQPSPTLGSPIVVVGDSSLSKFLTHHWSFDIGIFDLKHRRQPVTQPELLALKPTGVLANPAGTIQAPAAQAVSQLRFDQHQLIKIEGEEDLMVVPLALSLPLGSVIYYGQPDEGLVELIVTEQLKDDFYQQLTSHPNE